MRIGSLRLRDFRSYEDCSLAPCDGITVLIGDNGQGKTNILEAVYLTCTGRSHRTRQDRELVRWGADSAFVDIHTVRRDGTHAVTMALYPTGRRQIRVAGREISRSGELLGHVSGVLFSPEDLRTVKDGPGERRRFVDMTLSQLKPSYYYSLQRYNRALRQRNELLRQAAQEGLQIAVLDAWDEQLAREGTSLIIQRRNYIEALSRTAEKVHGEITGSGESLSIRYAPSIGAEQPGSFLEALRAGRDSDLRRMTTLIGPHRDDVSVLVNDRDARVYGSQGQQRTAALSMRLAELHIMRDELGEWPVLMLDDVMSELDPSRRRRLLERMEGIQTLVTCTDPDDLAGARPGAVYRIRDGSVEREE